MTCAIADGFSCTLAAMALNATWVPADWQSVVGVGRPVSAPPSDPVERNVHAHGVFDNGHGQATAQGEPGMKISNTASMRCASKPEISSISQVIQKGAFLALEWPVGSHDFGGRGVGRHPLRRSQALRCAQHHVVRAHLAPQFQQFIEQPDHFGIRHLAERLAIVQCMSERSRPRFGEVSIPGHGSEADCNKGGPTSPSVPTTKSFGLAGVTASVMWQLLPKRCPEHSCASITRPEITPESEACTLNTAFSEEGSVWWLSISSK